MLCPKCKTRNPIGFKFCHECGAEMALPVGELAAEEAVQAETERRNQHAAALLAGALELREQRQYMEAIPLAEEASEILPDSISAFALLASLYERTGDHDRAILAMEKVVELNPESAADKVRLERMKQGVELPEEPRRNPVWSQLVPIGAAAGVAAVIFGVGYPLLNVTFAPKTPAATNTIVETTTNSPANPTGTPNAPGNAAPPADNRPDPFAPLVQQAYRPEPAAPSAEAPASALPRVERPERRQQARERDPSGIVVTRRVPPASIPPQNNDGGNADSSNVGAGGLPNLGNGDANNSENASSGNFGAGGRIRVGPPTGGNNANGGNDTPAPPQSSGDGYIHVEVKQPSAPNSAGQGGGNAAPPAANSEDGAARTGESAMARGRRLYRTGKYREAIAAYREAGGAEAQQGIAAAQRALGDTNAARSAYREAARLYESQGDAAGAQTCRAALETLGG